MTELQEKLLEMLTWFHNFCVENEIKYFALAGTALGAVRHKGFIPWDDDIDVGIPRPDYDRLCKLSETVENARYKFEFPFQNGNETYIFGKLYDTTTTLIEHTRAKLKRGIYIDIFPLDGLGNTEAESLKRFNKIDKKINFLLTRICAIRKERKFYKNAAIIVSRLVPSFILNTRKLYTKIDEMVRIHNYYDCEYVANYFGNWHAKEIARREWFGKPTLAKFEGLDIYIPENYDSYLTHMYNNYMELPPKEKRQSHHDYLLIDLNKSYID